MNQTLRTAIALLFSLVLPALLSADICIDDYSDGNTIVQSVIGTSSQSTTGAGILGGQRDDSVTLVDLGGDEFIGSIGFNGDWILSQGSLDQIYGSLLYDNFSAYDLTGGGSYNVFALDFVSAENSVPYSDSLSITVTSGATSVTQWVTVPDSTTLGKSYLEFSDFAGIDFSSVDSISLDYNFAANPGRDFSIASFKAVSIPEPTAVAVLGLVGLGFLSRRRRRPAV